MYVSDAHNINALYKHENASCNQTRKSDKEKIWQVQYQAISTGTNISNTIHFLKFFSLQPVDFYIYSLYLYTK